MILYRKFVAFAVQLFSISIINNLLFFPTIAANDIYGNEIGKNSSKSIIISQAAEVVICEVTNIKTGQLALRFSPNGKSRAGLNNGNHVRFLKKNVDHWFYVEVVDGPNSQVNGLKGWVNSNYLECWWD